MENSSTNPEGTTLRAHLRERGKNFLVRFLREEDGQATIEYILVLSATLVASGMLARGILNALDSGVLKLGGQLEKDLKTGRAPLSVYQN